MTLTKILTKLSILAVFTLYSCSIESISNNTKPAENLNIYKNKNFAIKGITQFEDGFKIKADNIAIRATVSLIYPSDYSNVNLRNTTIATGLSDQKGNFIINPNQGFNPPVNQVLILEASKRIGGTGNAKISLRTNIKWNGNSWESISTPGIYINKKTTALSILSALDPNTLTSDESMNKLVYLNNTNVGNVIYNNKLTISRFNVIYKAVDNYLTELKDPVEEITEISPKYDVINYYTYAYLSSVKANMHTLQTMAETYAVDNSGIYPGNLEILETEAKNPTRNYWKDLKNPFGFYLDIPDYLPAIMNLSDYNQAKSTLTYQGHNLESKSQLGGIVVYDPVTATNGATSYYIYGVNFNGDFLKVDDRDNNSEVFVLTNQ